MPVIPAKTSRISLSLLLLLLGSSFLLCPSLFAAAKDGPKHVIVAPVVMKEISDRVEALGTARANESINITSSVTEKVSKVGFEDGQKVQTGDVLVVLDQAEEQANLRQAQAVKGERELSLNRQLQLQKQKLAAVDEIDRIRLELEQAEASISAIKTRINDRIIRAPFDGVIGLRNISLGALVETGDLIATLDDTRRIKLDFSVSSLFLSELKPGLRIRARAMALNNREFIGAVKSIDSRVDPVTRSIRVRAMLDNPDGSLLPGILLQVDLLRNTRRALVIPEGALLPLGERQYVLVRSNSEGKDTVEKRLVVIGLRLPGYVEIISGLSADEQVVTHGNTRVKPGDELDVMAVDDGSVDIAAILRGKAKSKGQ